MSEIDGATRLLAIIGDPIAQVRSPLVYNPRIRHAGRNAVLVPVHAPAERFATIMAGLMQTANLDAIVVTAPFKKSAIGLADTLSEMVRRVGALNAMRREPDGRWSGEMFDGVGLLRALDSLGQQVGGRRVKLIGAGGAGSAIAMSLAGAGAAAISIHDRNADRSAALARQVMQYEPSCRAEAGPPELGDHDLLINATPAGMTPGDALPVPLPDLSHRTTVVDIAPRPAVTPLLALARARGCPHVGGAAMVEGQADAVLEFFGIRATAPA